MKRTLPLFFLFFSLGLAAQSSVTVNSTNGYSVTIDLLPLSVNPAVPNNCQFGYNFTVTLAYSFTYSGPNVPAGGLTNSEFVLTCSGASNSNLPTFTLTNSPNSSGNVNTPQTYTGTSDCATVTVQSFGCFTGSLNIAGPGIPQQFINFDFTAALPVELTAFTATATEKAVDLNWSTASELDNDFFAVQRSADARQWETIARVTGNLTSPSGHNYSLRDVNPISGTAYYRLAQTDLDGTVNLSEVVTVNRSSFSSASLGVFPNPATQELTVRNGSDFRIYDLTGRDVTGSVTNTYPGAQNAKLDISRLATGIYVLRSGEESFRWVKR